MSPTDSGTNVMRLRSQITSKAAAARWGRRRLAITLRMGNRVVESRNQRQRCQKIMWTGHRVDAGRFQVFSHPHTVRLSSAKTIIVVRQPPSPGDTHDVSRQAQISSPHGIRRATRVGGRWPEHYMVGFRKSVLVQIRCIEHREAKVFPVQPNVGAP
jgi:hypothetical protein